MSCQLSLRTITRQFWSGKHAECIEYIHASYQVADIIIILILDMKKSRLCEDRE